MTVVSACQEGGEAGELHGQWRLVGSDTKYIRFSGGLACISNIGVGDVWGKFQHVGDSLFIQCYSIDGSPNDTTLIETEYGFTPFNNIRLRIESLNSDNLTFSQGDKIWTFYKY